MSPLTACLCLSLLILAASLISGWPHGDDDTWPF